MATHGRWQLNNAVGTQHSFAKKLREENRKDNTKSKLLQPLQCGIYGSELAGFYLCVNFWQVSGWQVVGMDKVPELSAGKSKSPGNGKSSHLAAVRSLGLLHDLQV